LNSHAFLAGLEDIGRLVLDGQRLEREHGLRLLQTNNILGLGYLANYVTRRKTGEKVYYNNNAHINYSNVCQVRCGLCAFGKSKDDPGAYTMSVDEVVERAVHFAALGVTEIHMVGGIHPDLPFSFYVDMIKKVKQAVPHVNLKAFTAAEYDHFARLEGLPVEEVLRILKDAGLSFIPGGGAENFSPRVREIICPGKLSGERWLDIHRTAHRLGIPSNANMLYGIIETDEELVDHLLKLRELQDETGGFYALVPTAFHPQNTKFSHLQKASAIRTLKVIAVSRLLLDNFKYIKAYWVSTSPELAQVALTFGANDLDGVVREEKIYHTAGASSPQMLEERQLIQIINELGLTAVERNTFYEELRVFPPQR